MKGSDFVDALRAAVAPVAIINIIGSSEGVALKLADGRNIKAERKAIAALCDRDEMTAYVKRVLS